MKTFGRALALMTMLVSCVFAASTLAFAAESNVFEVGNSAEFKSAVAAINGKTSGDYVIKLAADIESEASVSGPCPVTILGCGHTLTIGTYGSLQIMKGSHLSLGAADGSDALTIKGSGKNNDVPGLLYVDGGSCDMYAGVTLTDRKGNNYFGGGVTVFGGTFHMHGGAIENCGIEGGSVCYGGGVAVAYGGTFVMDDGKITGCYAKSDYVDEIDPTRCICAVGGGVFVSGGSSFTMNGGSISGNVATNMGGGVALIASYEEVVSGSGNLKSRVDLLGGAIDGNEAHDGAGVLASAYFYAYAGALAADPPSMGAAEKQGLCLGDVKLSNNKADASEGYGGGAYVVSTHADMSGARISGNSASKGAGVAVSLYADVDASGGIIANNVASLAGSDVYSEKSKVSLSSACDMGENYLGAPDDVRGSRIDGWYVDNESSRYASQQAGERQAFADYTSIGTSDSVSLVAASNNRLVKVSFTNEDGSVTYGEGWYEPGTKADQIQVPTPTKDSDDTFDYDFAGWDSEIADVTVETVYKAQFNRLFKVFGARYEFQSATPGQQLPDEVLALLPADGTRYPRGSEIGALTPSQTSVETADGTWTFVGYDRTAAEASMDNADDEGNVHFSGAWKFTRKATPAQPGDGGATAGANPAGKADGASSEGAQLPQTSDAFGPGALLALIAAGATSLIAAAAIRE